MTSKMTKSRKSDLWKIFETEKNSIQKDEMGNYNQKEENSSDENHHHHECHLCKTTLTIMEDGFPTCTNANILTSKVGLHRTPELDNGVV